MDCSVNQLLDWNIKEVEHITPENGGRVGTRVSIRAEVTSHRSDLPEASKEEAERQGLTVRLAVAEENRLALGKSRLI